MSELEKTKSFRVSTKGNRIASYSNMSPSVNMGAQGYSSDESEAFSQMAQMQHFPAAPNQLRQSTIQDDDMVSVITTQTSAQLPQADGYVRNYFKQSKGPLKTTKYNLKLQVQYETDMGDHLAVVGDIDQLGNWKDFQKCSMKWTEGHVWITENLVVDKPFFLYKYIIMRGSTPVKWEKGANRIADLHVLPDMERSEEDFQRSPSVASLQSLRSMKSVTSGNRNQSPTKSPTRSRLRYVNIQDEWEHFKIKFSINDPIEEQTISQGDFMRIIGSTPKLGSKNVGEMESTPPMKMSRTQRPIEWLIDKYGQKVRPWEIIISFQMGELELPSEIIYSYSKSNENGSSIIKERDPTRSMKIQAPETYVGELGKNGSMQFKNQQKVWIVNGVIDKSDANFLGSLYFDKIGDTKIYLGTYPLREDDVKKMCKAGITSVLNLQSKADIEQRGIPWDKLKLTYAENGILCQRFPVKDADEDELCASLFVAAQHLNNMLNKQNHTVYLHCTSGISRAPAVLLVYLCLFKRVKQWQNPTYVAQFVRAFHVNSNPNMRAVQRVVQANFEFQSQQVDHQSELKQNSQSDELEGFAFPQMHGQKRESLSPKRHISTKRSAYPSRKSSVVKPYEPKLRPFSPSKTEVDDHPAQLNKYKSQIVTKQDGIDKQREDISMDQPKVNPFNITNDTPEPQEITTDQAIDETPDENVTPAKHWQTDAVIETVQPEESDGYLSAQVKQSLEIYKNEMVQQTPRFEPKIETETLTINHIKAVTHCFEDNYSPVFLVQTNLRSVAGVFKPKPNTKEIAAKKRLEQELKAEEEQAALAEQRRLKYLEAKKVAEEEAIIEFEQEQKARLALESQQKSVENNRMQALLEARRIAQEESQKIAEEEAELQAQAEKDKVAQLEDQLIIAANEKRMMEEQSIQEEERQRKNLADGQARAARAQALREKRLIAEQERKEAEKIKQAEREKKWKEEEEAEEKRKQQEEEAKAKAKADAELEQKKAQEKRDESPTKRIKSSRTYTMTQKIQSTERNFIETKESVAFSGLKTINLRNAAVKTDEEELKRKQEETIRRARWSAKAVEQAAQEAAKQAEAEKLRRKEEERLVAEENERLRREKIRQEEEEQRQMELARKRQEEEKRRIEQEIREIEEQRRQIEQDQIRMEEEKRLRIIKEQKAREDEWKRSEQQRRQAEIDLQQKLEMEKIDEQNRQKLQIQQQEIQQKKIEEERHMKLQQEQKKRDEEQRKRLEEIREIEQRQRLKDEMEALSKFVLFDMIKENIRDSVTETFFEMEALEKERQQQIIEQAERQREFLKNEKLRIQSEEVKRRQEENQRQLEMQRVKKAQEDMQREKERLRLIAEENEFERRKIAEESERLRHQEEEIKRQERMRQLQLEQEEEAERQALNKIQREKDRKLEILHKQQTEAEQKRQLQLQEERAERQRLLEIAEKETEKIRQLKIKTAQEELLRLQQLRKEEEQRLIAIKQSYEEEEKNRQIQLKKQEEIEKQRQLKYKELEQAEKVKLLKRDLLRKQEKEEIKSRVFDSINSSPQRNSYKADNYIPEEPSEIQPGSSMAVDTVIESDANFDSVEKYCDELFREAPIIFKPKRGNKLDEQIQKMIKRMKITIPIVNIRQQSYLVGTNKVTLENKFQSIMIRVGGGGVERFDTYVPKNHRKMERQLIEYMSMSQQNLQQVVDTLVRGEKIKKKVEFPFQAKMVPNLRNQDLIRKVTVNLKQRQDTSRGALSSRSGGLRDESFLSRGSGLSSSRRINLSTYSGIRGALGRTSHVPISRGNLSPTRARMLYDGDESPTRFDNYHKTAEKFDHKKILEQMFAKKEMTNEEIRSVGSSSPTRFRASPRRNGWIQK